METLTPLQIILLIGVFLLTIFLLWYSGKHEAKRVHKVYGSAIYSRLCMFADFVNNCAITIENYNNIAYELKIIKGRPEMSDCVFSHKVKEITKNFERRFKQWIPIQDQTTPTN